ncbi:phage tail protein I [Vibrio cholerae]|nr:phage tail protein I [Vibrio cholerae]
MSLYNPAICRTEIKFSMRGILSSLDKRDVVMLPKILKQDIRLRTLSRLTTEEMNELRSAIKGLQVLDIDHVHESYLPWLAWWFRVDTWDDAWSVERKRTIVKEALTLYKYKGTIWAVERALELTGFGPKLTVWHQMNPVGAKGTFLVEATQEKGGLTQKDYENVVTLVESNKQGSQHWNMIVRNPQSQGGLYAGVRVRSRKRITTRNYPVNQAVAGGLYHAVTVRSRKRITVTLMD